MPVVSIRVNGKEYQVACDEGEEERLHQLAAEVDERIQSLVFNMKNKPGESLALLLGALMMADELNEKDKEIEAVAAEAKRAVARASVRGNPGEADARLAEMEAAMAETMEDIAGRIEKIVAQIEA